MLSLWQAAKGNGSTSISTRDSLVIDDSKSINHFKGHENWSKIRKVWCALYVVGCFVCIMITIMTDLELMSLIHVIVLLRDPWNGTQNFVVDQLVYFLFFMTSQLWCYIMARSILIGVQSTSIAITKKIIKSDVESPYTYQKNDLNIFNRFGHLDLARWTFPISKFIEKKYISEPDRNF